MVNWQDPSVIASCAFLYNQIAVLLLGFVANHVITRMDIEWSLITRRRKFNPVLIPYLFGRYSILATLITFVFVNQLQPKVACDPLYKSLAFLGSAASYCSTLNLGIRSYIIWKDMNRLVVWMLSLGCIVHAALVGLQAGKSVTFRWNDEAQACIVVRSSHITMFIFYLYTMTMDFVIVVLTICGLWRKSALRSVIGNTLSGQCLWYCTGTFICTIPAVVFPALNLNIVMNVIASMPATTFSVMMSSSAVLSLRPEEVVQASSAQITSSHIHQNRDGILGATLYRGRRRATFTTNITLGTSMVSDTTVSTIESRHASSSKDTGETSSTAV